ncbi:MAG: DpnD/PcfM family protein [Clostridia bacterium]|nr:DpnD/PcfM family protein [Clostridia bacterium]
MKHYPVEIEEIYQDVIKIYANSMEEALEKAQEKYDNNEIELTDENFKGAEIREFKDVVTIDEIKKDAFFYLKYGNAILLEGDKNMTLLKKINCSQCPYVIANNIQVSKTKTHFEWVSGSYFDNLYEASKEFNNRTKMKEHTLFSKLGKETLKNYGIENFSNAQEAFEFMCEEEFNKDDIVDLLSEEMKKKIILDHFENYIEENDEYFYFDACEKSEIENELNEIIMKISDTLNNLNIKCLSPFDILELLEENKTSKIDETLIEKVESILLSSGYKNSIESLLSYISQEIEDTHEMDISEEEFQE